MIRIIARRILRRKAAIVALALIVVILGAGALAPVLPLHDPIGVDLSKKLLDSSLEYPMGTDQLGRCVFSRVIYGVRTCLGTALLVTFMIMVLGIPLGLISGYVGGHLDNLIMRVVDICTTFPSTLLALALVGKYGPSLKLLVIVFTVLWWAPFARLIRGMVVKVREKDFVLAAQSGGCTRLAVVLRHIAPNVLSPIIVYATLRIAAVVAHVAGFSFIGLGSQPPTPDWGVMLNDGRQFITSKPMLLFWPGLAIMVSVLAFNLFGESLGEALTPDPEDLAKVKEEVPRAEAHGEEASRSEKPGAEAPGALEPGGVKPEAEGPSAGESRPDASGTAMPYGVPPAPPVPGSVTGHGRGTAGFVAASPTAMLKVRDLRVFFKSGSKVVRALDGVSLDVLSGRITAVVGSSGSGKSVLALSMLRLIEKPGWIEGGSIELDGKEILAFGERELRDYRGRGTAMIFQDPSGSMDPVSKVKNHLFEAARTPRLSRGRAMEDFRRILTRVGLKDPEKVLESYPFELSGGMCQRVMVAMGLASRAKVLIADEPTSSLDLTTQAAILEEFRRLRDLGLTMVLITHDLGVVAQTADDVYVLHDGRVIEGGPVEQVLTSPREAFTRSLLVSVSV